MFYFKYFIEVNDSYCWSRKTKWKLKYAHYIAEKGTKFQTSILLKNPGEMWRELHNSFLSAEISKHTDSFTVQASRSVLFTVWDWPISLAIGNLIFWGWSKLHPFRHVLAIWILIYHGIYVHVYCEQCEKRRNKMMEFSWNVTKM